MSKQKYNVEIPYLVWVTVRDVEAESKDEAIELAIEEACVDSYCGNNGSDKLIGVFGSNISIQAPDTHFEGRLSSGPVIEPCLQDDE